MHGRGAAAHPKVDELVVGKPERLQIWQRRCQEWRSCQFLSQGWDHEEEAAASSCGSPPRLLPKRAILLLWTKSVTRRGMRGNPSSFTISLSERSMLSNWFCGKRRGWRVFRG